MGRYSLERLRIRSLGPFPPHRVVHRRETPCRIGGCWISNFLHCVRLHEEGPRGVYSDL